MSLKQDIQAAIKEAMKAKNAELITVLRGAVASVNAKQMEKRYKLAKENPSATEESLLKDSELNDDEVVGVLVSEIKKRKDAIALYEQGGRPELAETEKSEITMLQPFLPEQLSVEDIKKMVTESIAATGAKEMKDMGKVMADLNPKIKGKADGGDVSKIVKELLGA